MVQCSFCFSDIKEDELSEYEMSLYTLEPATLFTVPITDRLTTCRLCHLSAIPYEDRPDINLGPLYQYGKPVTGEDGKSDLEIYCAHYYCLLFSPGKIQNMIREKETFGSN